MKYARIENGVVFEFIETEHDIKELFHPDLVWVPVTPEVEIGDLFDGTSFTKRVETSNA